MQSEYSKEQVLAAYNAAPDAVRAAFNSAETIATIEAIQKEYRLHADVAGSLGKQVGYMLLGLLSPTEFFGKLVLSGFDQNNARAVLDALNTRIFMPLQQRMREAPKAPAEPENLDYIPYSEREPEDAGDDEEEASKPLLPQNPFDSTLPGREITPTSPAEPPRTQTSTPPTIAQAPVISTPTQIASIVQPSAGREPAVAAAAQPHPYLRTMSTDMAALAHPQAAPQPAPAPAAPMPMPMPAPQGGSILPQAPHPWQTTPASSFQTASIPYTSVPTPSRPVEPIPHPYAPVAPAMPPAPAPRPEPMSLPGTLPPAPVPAAQPAPRGPIVKEYSADPYREPI